MDGQSEATAGANRGAVAGDGGPAVASVSDDDTGEIAVRVPDGDRHFAHPDVGTGVPQAALNSGGIAVRERGREVPHAVMATAMSARAVIAARTWAVRPGIVVITV